MSMVLTDSCFGPCRHFREQTGLSYYYPFTVLLLQGLYPESHGIIANIFLDPEFGEMFFYGGRNLSDNRWWLGEPVCC